MFATVGDKGQVTLPKKLRDQMGIQPGARLDLLLGRDGTLGSGPGPWRRVLVRPAGSAG